MRRTGDAVLSAVLVIASARGEVSRGWRVLRIREEEEGEEGEESRAGLGIAAPMVVVPRAERRVRRVSACIMMTFDGGCRKVLVGDEGVNGVVSVQVDEILAGLS